MDTWKSVPILLDLRGWELAVTGYCDKPCVVLLRLTPDKVVHCALPYVFHFQEFVMLKRKKCLLGI